MKSSLGKLVEKAGFAGEVGWLEETCMAMTFEVNSIMAELSGYLDHAIGDANTCGKAKILLSVYEIAEEVKWKDAIEASKYLEVASYLIAKRDFPLEKISVRAVLMRSTLPGSPFEGMDDMTCPEQFNFYMAYMGDTPINIDSYADTDIVMASSPFILSDEVKERRERLGLK